MKIFAPEHIGKRTDIVHLEECPYFAEMTSCGSTSRSSDRNGPRPKLLKFYTLVRAPGEMAILQGNLGWPGSRGG